MRILDQDAKRAVQEVITAHEAELRGILGYVSAEPGFPIVNGAVQKEPAIIVYVSHKKPPTHVLEEERAPRQLGKYRVAVMQADPFRQLMSMSDHEDMAARVTESATSLTYKPVPDNPINASFEVNKPLLCHVGPDAGWPVLKPFLEAAQHTLSVAMYDFNADYIAKAFIDAVRASSLQVVLTWDNGMTPPETTIRNKLKSSLGQRLDGWVVQCGAGRRFASAYHEKVVVRDSAAFWLSSGNWSLRSQPDIDPIGDPTTAKGMYGKGNREWHIIVEDEVLAKLFESYITHDRDGSEQEAEDGDPGAVLDRADLMGFPDVFVPMETLLGGPELAAIAEPVPPQILPSTARPLTVFPVLSPDNYIGRLMELLHTATRSIYLQFSYINFSDAAKDVGFREMLSPLAEMSYRSDMDIRIIVGSNGAVDKIRKLVESGFKETVFRSQRNVHNKGIVVDGRIVLVSSANWSGDGVLRNRDAGLIIHDEEVAAYYQNVFLDDWENRAKAFLDDDPPVIVAAENAETPPGMVRMPWREYFD